MIIKNPLTPEQIQTQSKPSPDDIRKAQDDLFMFLIDRVNELEAKVNPPKKARKTAT